MNPEQHWFHFEKLNDIPKIVSIFAGEGRAILLDAQHNVWIMGNNSYENLAVFNNYAPIQTQKLALPLNIKQVASGKFHTLFLEVDGVVWSCGYPYFGLLENAGTSPIETHVPQKITPFPLFA